MNLKINELKRLPWTDNELEVASDLEIDIHDIEDNIDRIRDMIDMHYDRMNGLGTRWDWFYDVYLEGKDEFKNIY